VELLDALSTYDKKDRGAASPETRRDVMYKRVSRSNDKISGAAPVEIVDDSLMHDEVGRMAQDYRQYTEYKGSERVFPADEGAPEMIMGDDDDANPNPDGNVVPADDDAASRHLIVPSRRVPDQANSKRVMTFSEYTGATPATAQFYKNVRHLKGPEQGVYMEVREMEDIYETVSETLSTPLANQEISSIAVERGLSIPNLPKVSKAEIQDGLCEPNYDIGERPCVFGVRCASVLMCDALKKRFPDRYAHAKSFACKEFYFGNRGKEVREAIALGTPLNEIQKGDPIMCVLCHLAIVTRWYKEFDLGLQLNPPHILHAFRVCANVPGGYPVDKCLMGDRKFKVRDHSSISTLYCNHVTTQCNHPM
jgi:hypothetical protein